MLFPAPREIIHRPCGARARRWSPRAGSSFMQSYFRYAEIALDVAGRATGRLDPPAEPRAFSLKQGWLSKPLGFWAAHFSLLSHVGISRPETNPVPAR
jgi:hypothetical protein